ncbi:MAG: peptidoglycan editing factor PgeF [Gammaproteobacteria bacterium]|nr:peptidoglycan editing factor PgeF [Gammaproteobacteria bacterium]
MPVSKDWIRADWPAPGNILAGTTTRLNEAFAFPAEPQWLNQVHGRRVVRAGSPDFDAGPPAADAIVADRPGEICVVRTADCLPILLCSTDGTEIAAVHGGWRGLAAGIVEATVEAMRTKASDLIVWFGPAISQAAFEVGAEVRDKFLADDKAAAAAFVVNERGRWQADLVLLGRQRLGNVGVTAIYGGGLCTYQDEERFFSYRRDGATGRLFSFVYRSR